MRLSRPIIVLLLFTVCVLSGQYLALTHTAERTVRSALTQATQLSNETVARLFVNTALQAIIGKLPLSPGLDADAEVGGGLEYLHAASGDAVMWKMKTIPHGVAILCVQGFYIGCQDAVSGFLKILHALLWESLSRI